MEKMIFAVLAILFLASPAWAVDDPQIKDDSDKLNYSIGYQIGGDFVNQGIELRPDMIVEGIRTAVEKTKPLITEQEMSKVLIDLKEKVVAEQRQQANLAGQDFLAEFNKQEGVVELPNGARYRVIKAGDGPQPAMEDSVEIQYIARTIDGTEISNTYKEDELKTYQIGRMLPGLRDVLMKMQQHAVWEVVVPMPVPGNNGEPGGHRLVIYEIELLTVKTPKEKAAGEKPAAQQ